MDEVWTLGRGESLRLLTTARVGRVIYTDRALPAVLPVRFLIDGGHVVFRTSQQSRLAAAVVDSVVAFEVDDVDDVHGRGWIVTVTGTARAVSDPAEWTRLAGVLRPGAPGPQDRFIRIDADIISGRLMGPLQIPAAGLN